MYLHTWMQASFFASIKKNVSCPPMCSVLIHLSYRQKHSAINHNWRTNFIIQARFAAWKDKWKAVTLNICICGARKTQYDAINQPRVYDALQMSSNGTCSIYWGCYDAIQGWVGGGRVNPCWIATERFTYAWQFSRFLRF